MARITVTFKGIPLQTVEISREDATRIGRSPASEVHIDSLALADCHAVIAAEAEGYIVRAQEPGFPVAVNDKSIVEAVLRSGDEIRVGKHVLVFTDDARPHSPAPKPERAEPPESFKPFEGSFQVLSGQRIGMVIPLKATVTRIGRDETGLVIVTRENRGHLIACGSDKVQLSINGQPVAPDKPTLLASGDKVSINSALLQYFRE